MTQVSKAINRLRPWLPLREDAAFSGAFDAVYSGAHADIVMLWQDALFREQKFEEQKQSLDEEWGAQAKDNRLQVVPEDSQRRFFDPLYEKARELETEKAQLEAALAREERKSELLTDKVEEWKASSDHWKERAEQAENQHEWPKVTPTGHTYVEPRTYEALRHEHDNAAQAEVECWAADECPPEPTWEMVGSAHREVERLQRERDTYAAMVRDRDDWRDKAYSASEGMRKALARAEAAEARTAHAVTREGVKGVIDHWIEQGGNHEALLDDLWALLSGSDPAVYVVRESDVGAQAALRNRFGEFVVNGTVLNVTTAEDCREKAQRHLDAVARCESIARAIEAEQADLVEEAAVAAFKAAWHRADEEGDEGNRVRRGIRAARHVLRQEASSDE